ncbi:hypothetical protein CTAYLR_007889 [Chrysophaeum taylorii]|uniref:Sulfatase N-terminal domain-containing protein n=1 Tax=Chrysophaeum taylorii TaxID=2483200 RepID=A0AAD7ULH3_9STRA|nr:hypothetical protein CTAYLR_007889 [Chrysophaeum taylorii]
MGASDDESQGLLAKVEAKVLLVPSPIKVHRRRLRHAHAVFASTALATGFSLTLVVAYRWRTILSSIAMHHETTASVSVVEERTHVIVAIADDLGYNDVGWGSSDMGACTPHVDAMRAEGIELGALYGAATCTPSRASLLTGRHPVSLGLQHWQLEAAEPWSLDPKVASLAETFLDAGYATALVGKWHLGHYESSALPTRRGFEQFVGFYGGGESYYSRVAMGACDDASCFFDFAEDDEAATRILSAPRHSTYDLTEAAQQIVSAVTTRPLFLVLALPNSHSPLEPPPEAYRSHEACVAPIKNLDRRAFAALTALWDDAVANVTSTARAALGDRVLWLVASDNGGDPSAGGSNYPLRGAKHYLYDGGVKLRAFFFSDAALLPAASRGKTYAGLMHIADVAPTLASAAALRFPTPDGVDHWTALKDSTKSDATWTYADVATRRNTSSSRFFPRNELLVTIDYLDANLDYLGFSRAAIVACDPRNGCLKALYNVEEVFWYEPPRDERTKLALKPSDFRKSSLFNLTSDPTERYDLSKREPDLFQALHAKIFDTYLPKMARARNLPTDARAYDAWRDNHGFVGPWLDAPPDPCLASSSSSSSRIAYEAELGLLLLSDCAFLASGDHHVPANLTSPPPPAPPSSENVPHR